jgi:hypothetical protein
MIYNFCCFSRGKFFWCFMCVSAEIKIVPVNDEVNWKCDLVFVTLCYLDNKLQSKMFFQIKLKFSISSIQCLQDVTNYFTCSRQTAVNMSVSYTVYSYICGLNQHCSLHFFIWHAKMWKLPYNKTAGEFELIF